MKNCFYCGSTRNVEIEHIIAKSKGGKKTILACRECNRSKGNRAPMEWLRWLKKNDKYRWNRIKNYYKRKSIPFAEKVKKIMKE